MRVPAAAAAAVPSRHLLSARPSVVASASLKDAATVHLLAKGEIPQLPAEPGVYAVYNNAGELQYIGLSRKVRQPLCFS